jgi:hypothetical protein
MLLLTARVSTITWAWLKLYAAWGTLGHAPSTLHLAPCILLQATCNEVLAPCCTWMHHVARCMQLDAPSCSNFHLLVAAAWRLMYFDAWTKLLIAYFYLHTNFWTNCSTQPWETLCTLRECVHPFDARFHSCFVIKHWSLDLDAKPSSSNCFPFIVWSSFEELTWLTAAKKEYIG